MKLLIIVLFWFAASCNNTAHNVAPVNADTLQPVIDHSEIPKADTVLIEVPVLADCKNDSLKKVADSLRTKLFLAKYKIERVKYYLRICNRNPSQTKFLRSWIDRAIQN
jgi:hypothetical protein